MPPLYQVCPLFGCDSVQQVSTSHVLGIVWTVLVRDSDLYNGMSSDNTSLPYASVSCKVEQYNFYPSGRGGAVVPPVLPGLALGLGSFLWLHRKAPQLMA